MTQWLASVGTAAFLTLTLSSAVAPQTGFSGRRTLMEDRSTFQLAGRPVIIAALGSDLGPSSAPTAQHHPDFSGTWQIVPDRSILVDEGHRIHLTIFGERFTARQTGPVLTIAIDNEKGFVWRYRLDGRQSENVSTGPNGPEHSLSTAEWSGATLTILSRVPAHEGKTELKTRRTMRLNPDGTLLVQATWGRDNALIGSVYSRVSSK